MVKWNEAGCFGFKVVVECGLCSEAEKPLAPKPDVFLNI
jgi:hypothetical protein